MKKGIFRIVALCLAASLLLTGCTISDFSDYIALFRQKIRGYEQDAPARGDAVENSSFEITPYAQMEYTRPDMEQIDLLLQDVIDLAAQGKSLDDVVDGILAFYDAYDRFYTNYDLSYIRYCGDLTDSYWESEYNFCEENTAVMDAGLDALYRALAASPLRDALEGDDYFGAGFFDAYEGESLYTDEFLALLEQETALTNQYYAITADALDTVFYSNAFFENYGTQMADVFVQLVALRQQIAAYAGYDSYPEFAYDFYYYRDYTPEQALSYMDNIQVELAGLYIALYSSDTWYYDYRQTPVKATYHFVQSCAETMGGTIAEAFSLLDEAKLYDISYSENKLDSSFVVFLSSYEEPFIFMNPDQLRSDYLTLAHEFGHFANHFASSGSNAGIDVAEVFSQGMEYLSLCYGTDTESLTKYKMADCLSTYIEQSAYAAFEHQVYDLTGEDLTVENVHALYERIGQSYGLDSWGWDSRDYVTIEHFFTNPMYVISYVVSNDAAFQFYRMEQETPGTGLELFQQCLDTEDAYFLTFVAAAGLEDPFQPGRLQEVRQILETVLF